MPAVSVLLPVRDAARWLGPSLASLWRQTLADFEVVAVNDGSSDGSARLLDREAEFQPRLRVVHTPHRGLPAALNTALALARSPILARHDADDLSHRERLAAQLAFLRARPGVGVVGARVRLFPSGGFGTGMRRWAAWHNGLLGHDEMRRESLIDSPLAHGTAMLRRPALEAVGGWRERGWAEDLDLWLRLFEAGARFAKLPASSTAGGSTRAARRAPTTATRATGSWRSSGSSSFAESSHPTAAPRWSVSGPASPPGSRRSGIASQQWSRPAWRRPRCSHAIRPRSCSPTWRPGRARGGDAARMKQA